MNDMGEERWTINMAFLLINGTKRQKYFDGMIVVNKPLLCNRYVVRMTRSETYETMLSTNSKEELRVYLDCMGLALGKLYSNPKKDIEVFGTFREYELVAK